MKNIKQNLYNNRYTLIAITLFAVGVFVRVFRFGDVPSGFNQDEAFAAYESFSIMKYGVDSAGYNFPTYFVSWGSGMNVLESYIAIPFMWLFGLNEVAFRIPQFICAVVSMPVLYLLLKNLFDKQIALVGIAVLAISPWHIILSRWGLESNLAPAFLLFGLFFLVKGVNKNAYLLLSALFFGISLYSYSVMWLSVPLMLLVFSIYLFITSRSKLELKYVVGSVIILVVLALPHILFLLINSGIIPEIKTGFISIPKLISMRSEEIALSNVFSLDSYKQVFKILFLQNDFSTNISNKYGMFYHLSTVFWCIGIVAILLKSIKDLKGKKFGGNFLVLSGFLTTVISILPLKNINITKANSIHIFTLIIIVFGIITVVKYTKKIKVIKPIIVVAYVLSFVLFVGFYFGNYSNISAIQFRSGVGEAVELINQKNVTSVAVDRTIYHSQILFYDKTSPLVFKDTVKFNQDNTKHLKAKSFGKYTFDINYNNLLDFGAYIIPNSHIYFFNEEDFEIFKFQTYSAVIRRNY